MGGDNSTQHVGSGVTPGPGGPRGLSFGLSQLPFIFLIFMKNPYMNIATLKIFF